MFEILMYLFENYMDGSVALNADQDTIMSELEVAGFTRFEIIRALEWLAGLSEVRFNSDAGSFIAPQSYRHYTLEESMRLGMEGRRFLLHLEQLHILDPLTREVVIDRLMALDKRDINLGRIKWVVLIALFNQPERKSSLALLQDMILSDAFEVLH